MKHGGKIAVGLAGALVFPAGLHAVTTDSPYQPIVERNVFGLKPPPPPPGPPIVDVPVPKITLQGIVSMFGKRQVLFKALMPSSKAGEAPKETSLILMEGQGYGDIEVLEINESAGAVKFKNHGQEQLLTLDKDGVKPPSSSAPGGPMAQPGVPGVPGVPRPAAANFNPVPEAANQITTFGGGARGTIPTRTLRVSSAGGGNAGMGSPQPQAHGLSAEEQTVIMEVNRKLTEKEVAEGTMPPLPPTGFQ